MIAALLAVVTGCGGLCPPLGNNPECEFYQPPDGTSGGVGEHTDPDPCHAWDQAGQAHNEVTHGDGPALFWVGLDDVPQVLGNEWGWTAVPAATSFEPAKLDVDGHMVLYTTLIEPVTGDSGRIWLQADAGLTVTLASDTGSLPVSSIEIAGENVYYAEYTAGDADLGNGNWYWTLEGNGYIRGQSSDVLALAGVAGPELALLTSTSASNRAFWPTSDWCHHTPFPDDSPMVDDGSAPEPGTGDGGGEPEPEPEPEPQHPCVIMHPQVAEDEPPWIFRGEIPLMLGATETPPVVVPPGDAELVTYDDAAVAWIVQPGPRWAVGLDRIEPFIPFGPTSAADLRRTWIMVDPASAESWELTWLQHTPGEDAGAVPMVWPLDPIAITDGYAIAATGALPLVQGVDIGTERWGFSFVAASSLDSIAGTGAAYEPGSDDGGFWPYARAVPWGTETYVPMHLSGVGWTPYGGTCLYDAPEPSPDPLDESGG